MIQSFLMDLPPWAVLLQQLECLRDNKSEHVTPQNPKTSNSEFKPECVLCPKSYNNLVTRPLLPFNCSTSSPPAKWPPHSSWDMLSHSHHKASATAISSPESASLRDRHGLLSPFFQLLALKVTTSEKPFLMLMAASG